MAGYRFLSEKGEFREIDLKVRPDEEHREIYVHGASGGPLANYHYRIDFYRDIIPPFEYLEREGKLNLNSVKDGIERRIMVSVYMPLPFLKELRNWLDKNIRDIEKQYGEIQLPRPEEVEENNDQETKQRKEA